MCAKRSWREKNPIKAAYGNLKSNAKKRNKEFNLTFEDFKELCEETDYMKKKGKTSVSYHIDRIDRDKGYTKTNIQILTNRGNYVKYLTMHWNPAKREMVWRYVTEKLVTQDEILEFWDNVAKLVDFRTKQQTNINKRSFFDVYTPQEVLDSIEDPPF